MYLGSMKLLSYSDRGDISLKAKDGGIISFPSGQIITEQIIVKDNILTFDKSLFIGVETGLKLKEMDYQEYMKTGRTHSS